ncbi:MAG: hypothetical protein ACODTU_05795 [Pigmentiphaga sp.]|uniref:DODA-type extradiol aromatic ring-opening family dioxygenase n=1 Tax=Pigmentiphaga sp. TaxID=1977564 RepID=UPI003B565004
MGEIVWAAATAHTGAMMRAPKGDPDDLARADRVFQAFSALSASLKEARPDVLVVVATDHFLTFDQAALPVFAIGTGAAFPGHGEFGVPRRDYTGVAGLGEAVHAGMVAAGFDAAGARGLPLDHSFSCPLQLLLAGWDAPVLPVYVNCTIEPLPRLDRCLAFGRVLGDVLRAQDLAPRVAVLGTGGLSHWVGMPETGHINRDFDRRFLEGFAAGRFDEIAGWDAAEVVRSAGNGAAEIRNWLLAAGTARATGARVAAYEPVQAWVTGIGVTELLLPPGQAGETLPAQAAGAGRDRNALERYLFRFDKEPALQEALKAGAEHAFDGHALDDEERRALRERDLATLYEWGVHPLLIRNFAGTLGLPYVQAYHDRGLLPRHGN